MSDGAFLVDGVAAFDALPRTLRYRGLESDFSDTVGRAGRNQTISR